MISYNAFDFTDHLWQRVATNRKLLETDEDSYILASTDSALF